MSYKLVTSRDTDLFSNVHRVLGAIEWCENNGATPAVRFDTGRYLDRDHGPNWWEYYFERLSDIDPMSLNVAASEDSQAAVEEMWERVVLDRHRAAEIIRRHIRIRSELSEPVAAFWQRHLSGRFLVGIDFGSTGAPHDRQGMVQDDVLGQIEAIVRDRPGDSWRLVAVSGRADNLDRVRARFGNCLIDRAAICDKDFVQQHKRSCSTSNPNIDENSPYRLGLQSIQDALLLSRCDVFFGGSSDLSFFVAARSPAMPRVRVDGEVPGVPAQVMKELATKESTIQSLYKTAVERVHLIERLHDDIAQERGQTIERLHRVLMERLSADIEARVQQIEMDFDELRDGWRAKFRPTIFRHRQYRPRDWRVPQHYTAEGSLSDPPTIAIVTPSFNQGHYIERTIRSVLDQNYPALRYTVQDGGSTDDTLAVLDRFRDRLTWTTEADDGQSDAINRGFARIEGDIMAWLNSDDMLLPGTLAYVARFFHDHPDVDVVYGHRICVDMLDKDVGRIILPRHDPEAIKWIDYIPQETMFWRRRVWDALAGIDQQFQFAMDWDFILRAHAAGFRFYRLPRFLGCFRVHNMQKNVRLSEVGEAESLQLRLRHLGQPFTAHQIQNAIRGYLRRHVLTVRAYKLRLVRY